MDYEIKMPVLSDTMESGKLIKWHVKEGQSVKKGDVIADVESDKAIMEVQTFKSGVVKKLFSKEGENIDIGKTIAVIETETENIKNYEKPIEKKRVKTVEKNSSDKKIKLRGIASAAAKKTARDLDLDIENLQKENKLPKPAHLEDIKQVVLKRYFTPKALKLFKGYLLKTENFTLDHKINSTEVKEYISKFSVPAVKKLSSNRKGILKTLQESIKKPVYHIYETLDLSRFLDSNFKLTSILIKITADSMQNHPQTRALLKEDGFYIYPNSSVSVAVSRGEELYMVVIKNANLLSLEEIDNWVREIKQKDYMPEDLNGSTFGISNLGMYNIKAFDAIINKNDSGIAAFGSLNEGKISVVFSFDHRILNGKEAALFVKEMKRRCKNG